MDTEALLAELEGRGIRVTLLPGGKLKVGPSVKLKDLDRDNLARYKPDLVALLTRRAQTFRPAWYQSPRKGAGPHPKDSAVRWNSDHPPGDPGSSPADTKTIANVVEALDASLVSVGPLRQHTPAAPAAVSPATSEDKQPSLSASQPTDKAPEKPGASAEVVESQPASAAGSAGEQNPQSDEPTVAEAPEPTPTHDAPPPPPEPLADASSEPEPPAPAVDAAHDPAQHYDADPTNSEPAPDYYSQAQPRPERSERVVLWVTVERLHIPKTGQRFLRLKLTPSSSTDPAGVRFAVQEVHQSKLRRLVGATELEQDGIRVTRPTAGLRLGIEVWR